MKTLQIVFLVTALLAAGNCRKMVVTYLGTDFILPGGCPPPQCNPKLRDCRQEQIEREEKFNDCMSSKATKQGCFTDKLADGKLLTIPILANFCSKLCAVDSTLDTIHECPYEGFIHQKIDPELQRRIGE